MLEKGPTDLVVVWGEYRCRGSSTLFHVTPTTIWHTDKWLQRHGGSPSKYQMGRDGVVWVRPSYFTLTSLYNSEDPTTKFSFVHELVRTETRRVVGRYESPHRRGGRTERFTSTNVPTESLLSGSTRRHLSVALPLYVETTKFGDSKGVGTNLLCLSSQSIKVLPFQARLKPSLMDRRSRRRRIFPL